MWVDTPLLACARGKTAGSGAQTVQLAALGGVAQHDSERGLTLRREPAGRPRASGPRGACWRPDRWIYYVESRNVHDFNESSVKFV